MWRQKLMLSNLFEHFDEQKKTIKFRKFFFDQSCNDFIFFEKNILLKSIILLYKLKLNGNTLRCDGEN